MKFSFGVVAGAVGYWFYLSRVAKPLGAPEFLERACKSANSAANAGVQRTVEVIGNVPLPDQVKGIAVQLASTMHAQSTQHSAQGEPAEPATFSSESASQR